MAEKNKPETVHVTMDGNGPFAAIQDLIKQNYRFTNEQMDILIEVPLMMIPPGDRQILCEVAVQNKCPLWQAVIAQFRRTNEQGYAYALLLDPGWIQEENKRDDIQECPECKELFTPKNPGQKYCSNLCGSAEDRRRIAKLEAQRAELEAATPNLQASSESPPQPPTGPRREAPGIVPIGAEAVAREIR